MPPQEKDRLLPQTKPDDDFTLTAGRVQLPHEQYNHQLQILPSQFSFTSDSNNPTTTIRCGGPAHARLRRSLAVVSACIAVSIVLAVGYNHRPKPRTTTNPPDSRQARRSGPYELSELHRGPEFADFYDFYEGADSVGSAGYNTYISRERAIASSLIRLVNATVPDDDDNDDGNGGTPSTPFVYIQSLPTKEGPRESIRLEGKTRWNAGLFVLDLDHLPAGCGQWPAFWLTDEDHWPDHGEIDIVEGINDQSVAKTALHTGNECSMYAHVPDYAQTGHWDRSTGIPDTFTGRMDYTTSVPADNCWVLTPHQWANQGCVAVSDQNHTLGAGLNKQGGGVYALQWDPLNRYIRSWVFPKAQGIPVNLQDSMISSAANRNNQHSSSSQKPVAPDPNTWGLPYGYFAIGETTGCSADHFQNMRIVLNTAFCGTVAGNRFFTDCPTQAAQFNVSGDPVKSCNAWIASDPEEMKEAFWKIRAVYVYERAWEAVEAEIDKPMGV